jgi:aspartate/glutamate racemase
LIGKIIKKIVLNKNQKTERKQLLKLINKLKIKGADFVLLACTDLQLVVQPKTIPKVIDSMEILLESTVQKILVVG